MEIDILTELYHVWLKRPQNSSLEAISADELLLRGWLTPEQESWLEAFTVLWEYENEH